MQRKQIPKKKKNTINKLVKADKALVKTEMKRVPGHIQALVNPEIVQEARDAAMMIACPGFSETKRWSSIYSQKKTAVAAPFQIISSNFGIVGGNNPGYLLASDCLAFAFRSAERAAIIYDQNSAGTAFSYLANFAGFNNSFSVDRPAEVVSDSVWVHVGDISMPVPLITLNAIDDYAPHGPLLFTGSVGNSRGQFVYLNQGDSFSGTLNATVNCTFDWQVDVWDGSLRSAVYANSLSLVAGSDTAISMILAAPTNGYYSVLCKQSTSASTVPVYFTAFTLTGTGSCFCHLTQHDLNKLTSVTDGNRILGTSLMYTNTSNQLNRGGQIASVQTGDDTCWLDYVSSAGSFSNVSSTVDSVTMDATNGMYAFLKPTQPSDFNFQDYYQVDQTGNICASQYPIDRPGSYLAMAINIPDAAGCLGLWTHRASTEFITETTWFSVGKAKTSAEHQDKALMIIRDLEQFHENPSHISDLFSKIGSFIKSAAEGVVKYAPLAFQVGKTIASFL